MEDGGGKKRQDGYADAHIDPAMGKVGGQHRAISGIAPGLLQAHGRQLILAGLFVVHARHLPPDDKRGQRHAHAVDEKWPAEPQEGQAGTKNGAGDVTEQEGSGVGGRALAANRRRGHAHDKAHGRDGEHGRANAGQGAQGHDVPVALRNGD